MTASSTGGSSTNGRITAAWRLLLQALNRIYQETPALWQGDASPAGFEWIDANDADQSVLSFLRLRAEGGVGDAVACVANFTPVPRYGYRVGLPAPGRWREVVNTDALDWGGSGVGNHGAVDASDVSWHGQTWSAAADPAASRRALADARLERRADPGDQSRRSRYTTTCVVRRSHLLWWREARGPSTSVAASGGLAGGHWAGP